MSSKINTDDAADIALQLDERRLHILRIAAQTFSEMGFQRATLDDVAARLGDTKPALYIDTLSPGLCVDEKS
jgi:AcrR family transcriptional regulator